MEKRFEFLDHVADAYVVAYGKTLEEAFQNAALAMFELMTDTRKVVPQTEDKIVVEEWDQKALLYSWLEQLLLKFEIYGRLYSRFKISELVRTEKGWRLRAIASGEPFNRSKHESKAEIKAVTYHQMEIMRKDEGYAVKFILDL